MIAKRILSFSGLLFAVALCVRLVETQLSGRWAHPLIDEPSEEVVMAQGLAEGLGFVTPVRRDTRGLQDPSAYSAPGYPYLLAGLIRVFGGGDTTSTVPYRIALLLNITVGSLAVLLLALAVRRDLGAIGFWVTGLLAAVWPTLIRGSLRIWDTAFAMLAIAIGARLLSRSHKPAPTGLACAGLGAAGGLLTLFNPVTAPFLALAATVRLYTSAPFRKFLVLFILLSATWAACIAPWFIRNSLVFKRLVPMRNTFGYTLWVGNLPESDGTVDTVFRRSPFDSQEEGDRLLAMGEDAYMQMKDREARELIRSDPASFLRKTGHRIGLYWFGDVRKRTVIFGVPFPMIGGVNLLKALLNGFLLLAALAGLFLGAKLRHRWIYWFGVLYLPLPFYLTHVSPHYRVYVDPVMLILVAPLAAMLVVKFRDRKTVSCGVSGENDS